MTDAVLRAAAPPSLSAAVKACFLDHLTATGDVAKAATAAGVDPLRLYSLHRRNARFRAEWQQAVSSGYQLLETRLLGQALASESGAPQLAVQLLQLRRQERKAEPAPAARAPRGDDTDKAILQRLAAIERRRHDDAGR